MKLKQIITLVLLVFVIASVASMIYSEMKPVPVTANAETQAVDLQKLPMNEGHRVVAYYFHGTTRCMTCRTIEAYTDEALFTAFKEELDKGLLIWNPINVEEPQNQHFVDEYQLHTRSVVLSDMQNGQQTRWKNLEDIWNLVNDKNAFLEYIRKETAQYLAGVQK